MTSSTLWPRSAGGSNDRPTVWAQSTGGSGSPMQSRWLRLLTLEHDERDLRQHGEGEAGQQEGCSPP